MSDRGEVYGSGGLYLQKLTVVAFVVRHSVDFSQSVILGFCHSRGKSVPIKVRRQWRCFDNASRQTVVIEALNVY